MALRKIQALLSLYDLRTFLSAWEISNLWAKQNADRGFHPKERKPLSL